MFFAEETRPAYDRVHLTDYFAGKSPEELCLASADWYHANQIILHLSDPVREINRSEKIVYSHKGIAQPYDYLILSTGSSPFIPPIAGTDKDGVFVYRTLEDLEAITAYSKRSAKGAVIGGGLLGLEAAKAMLDLGIGHTTVIEYAPRLMPRQLDEPAARTLSNKLESLGLKVDTGKQLVEICGNERVSSLRFADNTTLDVDMVIISAGIKARDELAVHCALATGMRGGIIVNEFMETSDPDIFAIGECALYNNMQYGLVAPGYDMAEVVACRLTEGSKIFTGFDMSTKLKLVGVDVASFGDPFPHETQCRSIVFEDKMRGTYKRINVSPDGKQLLGGILVGRIR